MRPARQTQSGGSALRPSSVRAQVEALEGRRLLSVALAHDLNPTTQSLQIYNKTPIANGGVMMWTHRGLVVSDGSPEGTAELREGLTVNSWSPPGPPTRVDSQYYFYAAEAPGGANALWRTDGTPAGTVKVSDTGIGSLYGAGGMLFSTQMSDNTSRLYRFDTVSGTPVLLKQFTSHDPPGSFTEYGGKVYFAANGPEGTGLWSTDGTGAGTTLVKAMYTSSGNPTGPITVAGGLMYFAAWESGLGEEPWRSDGTAAGTHKLRELSSGSSSPRNFVELDATTVVFVANGDLYRTQGTSATTVRIAPVSSDPPYGFDNLTRAGGSIFATATQYYSGKEVWKTDGTNAGTVRVKDIGPGNAFTNPGNLFAMNDKLVFAAYDPVRGVGGLWTSDGTEAGTVPVLDTPSAMSAAAFVPSGSRVFFNAVDPIYGNELHVLDSVVPGAAAARLVRDLATTPNSSNPTRALSFGGHYYVTASWPAHTGWFRSDGTSVTPVPAPAAGIPSAYNAIQPHMTTWNGAGYFHGNNASGFYRIDPSGVTLLSGIATSPGGNPMFQPFGGKLFFPARPGNLTTVFGTDGTPGGTAPINVNTATVTGIAAGGGSLYFAGTASTSGEKPTLWKSDGTTAGTMPLLTWTPNPNTPAARFRHVTWYNGALYFMWTELSGNYVVTSLYRTDGTAAPTLVKQFNGTDAQITTPFIAGGKMLFGASLGTGIELWASDGTPEGTQLVKDIYPGGDSVPRFLTAAGDGVRAYFTAKDGQHGEELWVTDGTAAGTTRLTDVNPGPGHSMVYDTTFQPVPDPNTFAVVGGRLFFNAKEAEGVRELWETDGTPGGTRRVTNFGAGQYDPGPLAVGGAGNDLVLFAGTGPQGRELYRAAVAPVAPPLPAWLTPGSAAAWDAGTKTLTMTGAATIAADPGDDAPLIVGTSAATHLTIAPAAGNQVAVGGLTLSNGATVTFADAPAERVLVVGPGGLSVTGSAKLDLADNALVLRGGTALPAVQSLVTAGHHGGDWLGAGLTSSVGAADATRATALGYATAGQLGVAEFLGVTGLAATDVIVRQTYYGDTNLDRLLNTDDILNILTAGKLDTTSSSTWFEGDFTFDGFSTTDDILQLLATGRLDQA